jgi:hypothetical protein
VRKIVIASGVVTTLAGTAGVSGSADGIGAAASFHSLTGIASDAAGNLYVADSGNSTIRKIAIATGTVSTPVGVAGHGIVQLGTLPASLSRPAYLAVVGSDVAITDYFENSVLVAHNP